jgi:hypothetical protein
MRILSADLYKGFGPTLASEYLADKHDIDDPGKAVACERTEGEGGTHLATAAFPFP